MLMAATVISGCHEMRSASKHDRVKGLERGAVVGSGFVHTTFYRSPADSDDSVQDQPLFVYLEGDGRPWNSAGTAPRRNPDPRRALAVELAAMQEGDVAVLGRPCYFGHAQDSGCTVALWTDARYSEPVVASMAAALQRLAQPHGPRPLVLVGYSGGGSLALLTAERVPSVKAVVTVAANLDLDAWVNFHGYRPLAGSLDPLKARTLALGCEIHIAAEHDDVVPFEQSRQAVARRPASQLWVEPQADHACCWTRRWPELMARIRHQLESSRCFADRS
jgi:dienelactone hydrolase